jgi:TonB family protein
MNFFSDPHETARRFGDYIEDLHDIFRCNGIDFGSPQDFFAFARALKYQSDLRSDVMRVVKSLREAETTISFRTILTIVAVASGGTDVATSDQEMNVPVQHVVESLNRPGPGSQHNAELADLPDNTCSNLVTETNGIGAPERTTPEEEVTGHREVSEYKGVEEPLTDRLAVDSSVDTNSIEPGSINLSIDQGSSNNFPVSGTDLGGSNTVAESLTRLELDGSQLKTYLDSIEQRITRIEPRLENIPSPILPAPPVRPLDESEAGYFATVFTASEPRQPHNDLPVPNQGRVAREPTETFTSLLANAQPFAGFGRKRMFSIFVGVTTLVFGASLLWMLERDSGNVVRRSTNALVGADGQSTSSIKEPQEAKTGQVSSSEDTATQTPKKKSAKIPFRSPQRPSLSHAVNAKTQPVTSAETSEIVAPSDGAYGLSSEPLEHRPVDVSSDVMAANLVSDPQPTYPFLANLTHMQGSVVMQAVISRNGTVERVHVIKGHHLLRNAAKSAVQTWRYRPYKIDGVPVEVATVVSVDFSRHPPLNP